jgi:hypothetical protein
VGFLGLFVKLALQTNKKLGLKSLQWVLLGRGGILKVKTQPLSPIPFLLYLLRKKHKK